MKSSMYRSLLLCSAGIITAGYLSGCSSLVSSTKGTSDTDAKNRTESVQAVKSDVKGGQAENMSGKGDAGLSQVNAGQADQQKKAAATQSFSIQNFSAQKYEETMLPDRIAAAEYKKQYQGEIDKLQNAEFKNLHFDHCAFSELPDFDELEVFVCMSHGITVQESWDTVQQWLKEIGMQEEIDSKKDIRVVSSKLGTYWDGSYYPFYENMEKLDSGTGVHVQSDKCHIQIADNGIYSMSNGKIAAYLNYKHKASADAFGVNAEDVVEAGTLSELGNKKYELIDGKMSVAEGAQLVKDYFQAGTPFPCEEGVEIDIHGVRIFRLKDVYGYDYTLRRRYKSVPFSDVYGGGYYEGSYRLRSDDKHAYVAESSGVSAFCGNNESEKLVTKVSEDKLIGIAEAAEIVSRRLPQNWNVQINEAELVYVPLEFEPRDGDEAMAFPCWQFQGVSSGNLYDVWIGVDVFTGGVYYKKAYRD